MTIIDSGAGGGKFQGAGLPSWWRRLCQQRGVSRQVSRRRKNMSLSSNQLTLHSVPFFFVLYALLALQMDPHPPPSSLSSIQILVIRCSAGSDDQAHCTASRQELIEREGGIWGSNPEKNPFHDYFKVNLFESVCCTLKKTIEDTNPTLWYLGVRPFLFKWLLFWHKR